MAPVSGSVKKEQTEGEETELSDLKLTSAAAAAGGEL